MVAVPPRASRLRRLSTWLPGAAPDRWQLASGTHPLAKLIPLARSFGPAVHNPTEDRMTMTAREAFEKGTATFNAHDLEGFTEVLADNVVFKAPGGMHGEGKA